jgi:hypothetical protein
VYASNNRASKYMKEIQSELKGEIDKFISVVEDFNTPFNDLTSREKNSKDTEELNNTINQNNQTEFYRYFH